MHLHMKLQSVSWEQVNIRGVATGHLNVLRIEDHQGLWKLTVIQGVAERSTFAKSRASHCFCALQIATDPERLSSCVSLLRGNMSGQIEQPLESGVTLTWRFDYLPSV